MRLSQAEKRGLTPLAKVFGHAAYASTPAMFPSAPVKAVTRLFEKTGWSRKEVDLWEVNEAFAVVSIIAIQYLGLSHDQVNIHGGACALGHPIGASGARIVVTLLSALRRYGLKKGIATVCISGGEATALALEVL